MIQPRYSDSIKPLLDAGMSFWWNDEAKTKGLIKSLGERVPQNSIEQDHAVLGHVSWIVILSQIGPAFPLPSGWVWTQGTLKFSV